MCTYLRTCVRLSVCPWSRITPCYWGWLHNGTWKAISKLMESYGKIFLNFSSVPLLLLRGQVMWCMFPMWQHILREVDKCILTEKSRRCGAFLQKLVVIHLVKKWPARMEHERVSLFWLKPAIWRNLEPVKFSQPIHTLFPPDKLQYHPLECLYIFNGIFPLSVPDEVLCTFPVSPRLLHVPSITASLSYLFRCFPRWLLHMRGIRMGDNSV